MNKNKTILLISFLILFLVAVLTFFVLNGSNNIFKLPSQLTKQQELSQLPVFFEPSNTIAVVCPQQAKDNLNYPDFACKNTQYFGYTGLVKAVNDGGNNHTVYIKNGIYILSEPLKISSQQRYLTIAGENRNGVLLVSKNPGDTILMYGDMGINVENLTLAHLGELSSDPNNFVTAFNVGQHTSATFKNLVIYNFNKGIKLQFSSPQLVQVYQTVFISNDIGIETKSYNSVVIKNNIFYDSRIFGVVVSSPKYMTSEDFSTYSSKEVSQNTFYKNVGSIKTNFPSKTKIINNTFSKTVDYELTIEPFLEPDSFRVGSIDYNFSDSPRSNFCILTITYVSEDCTGVFDFGNNKSDLALVEFANSAVVSETPNFRLKDTSQLNNVGNPTILNRDGSRSSPGAYGGSCSFNSTGCEGLEFPRVPNLINLPPEETTDLDTNKDGKVDIKDVIFLLKYIFQ